MKRYFRLAAWLGLAVSLTLTAAAADYETVPLGKQSAVANRVLAQFKADVPALERTSALDSQRARVRLAYSVVPGLVSLELLPLPGPNLVVPGQGPAPADPGKALLRRIKALQATGAFDYVEPDYVVRAFATPSDSGFQDGTLWGLNNLGQNGGVAGADIGAVEAWDITTGSANVIVGVIDSGIRYTHQDLATQMWINPGEIPGNGIDDDGDGYIDNVFGINAIIGSGDPMDDNDHGTHVAGTIGAQANGGGPHVGVAWNVRLMALKFLDANGSGTFADALECINFAVAEKARLAPQTRMILNNSWGGGGFSQSLLNAIIAARNAGILFVAAAGNESNDNDGFPAYPATYNVDNVVSVAAMDRFDELANFSNYGANTVHLGAPGVSIFSTTSGSDTEYGSFAGTSMAAPHVAGVAALIWAQFPDAPLFEVRERLFVGTVPIPALTGRTTTGGRLNAPNSLGAGPDGTLKLAANPVGGLRVNPGSVVRLAVRLTDFLPVNNGTVTGSLSTGNNLTFLNNGSGPDAVAGDNEYSTQFTVPPNVSTFAVNLNATAPGKAPASRSVVFTVSLPPANDRFVNREVITSLPALRAGANRNASRDAGEPLVDPLAGGNTIWYSWRATQSGVVIASTEGSDFDTLLGVYTGGSLATLNLIGFNDDVPGTSTSLLLLQVTANTTYHFVVDGFFGSQGGVQFNLQAAPSLDHDNFAARRAITALNGVYSSHNLGATDEPNEPFHGGLFPNRTVWWEWDNPGFQGPVVVATIGSSFDTVLGVYRGSQLGSLVLEAGNNNTAPGRTESQVQFTAQPGQRYQIAVGSNAGGEGGILLSIARAPDNNHFESARLMSGAFAQDTGFNLGATGQLGEPGYNPSLNNSKSIWWRWTAPWTGKAVLTTDGSRFDTTLAVYTGESLNALNRVGFNDDRSDRIFTSLLAFGAVAGTTYHFKVDGFRSDIVNWVANGPVNLSLTLDGASFLSAPEFRGDNTLSLELVGEPERPYILSSTPDFLTWTPLSTNTPISRRLILSQPRLPGQTRYFRTQPASLLGED